MLSRVKRNDKIGFIFFLAFVLSTSLIWVLEERFEKKQWENAQGVRYKLADDLIESEILIEKTKSEVIALLGQPDNMQNGNHDAFLYELGIAPSFFDPKMKFLQIIFVNEKVIEVTQIQE